MLNAVGLGRDLDVLGVRLRSRNPLAFRPHAFHVKSNRGMHARNRSLPCRTGSHAARKVRRVRRVACLGVFYDDKKSHDFSPSCLKILLMALADSNPPEVIGSGKLATTAWSRIRTKGFDS